MVIQQRNIATCIILTIVTCGIYGILWTIYLNDDTNRLQNNPNAPSGGMVILLSLVTCGIYAIYWIYKRGEIMDNYIASTGAPKPNNAVIYIVLSIFGLSIVAYALLQSELNKIAAGGNNGGNMVQ